MESSELEYYRARLAAEEMAAERALHPVAAECHRRLAESYRLLVAEGRPAAAATAG